MEYKSELRLWFLVVFLAISIYWILCCFNENGNFIYRSRVKNYAREYLEERYVENFDINNIKFKNGQYIVDVKSKDNRFKEFQLTISLTGSKATIVDEYAENTKKIDLISKTAELISTSLETDLKQTIPNFVRADIYIYGSSDGYLSENSLLEALKINSNIHASISIVLKGKNITESEFVNNILSAKNNKIISELSGNSEIAFYYYPKYSETKLAKGSLLQYPYYSVIELRNSSMWNKEDVCRDVINWKIQSRYIPSCEILLLILGLLCANIYINKKK